MSLDYFPMLLALAKAANARRILEIGGGPEGVSGQAFAQAMGEGGELWTIDVNGEHPPLELRSRVSRLYLMAWAHVPGDSLTVELPEYFPREPFDLLYIDGDHGGDHAMGDFRRFSPMVREGGLVIFDDFPISGGVVWAVDQLLAGGDWIGLPLVHNHEDGNSHYVLRRRLACPL